MTSTTTTKTIWYKQVEISTGGAKLQPLLASALSNTPTASARMMQLGDTAERHGINTHSVSQNMLVGQFLSFEAGLHQPLVTIGDAAAYDLRGIQPPKDKDGKRTEWLDSIVYFACLDDHLLLAPTRSLSSREFERYLWWLLAQTGAMPDGTYLVLKNQPSAKAQSDLRKKCVRAVTVGSKVETVAITENPPDQDGASLAYELSPSIASSILNALPEVLDKLNLTDAINEDKLDVQVTVRVKGPRKLSQEGSKLLDAVSRATRHMDPRDYSITLDHVGTIKGDDLKLSKTVSVRIVPTSGLVDETDVFQKMAEYLLQLMNAKVIGA